MNHHRNSLPPLPRTRLLGWVGLVAGAAATASAVVLGYPPVLGLLLVVLGWIAIARDQH